MRNAKTYVFFCISILISFIGFGNAEECNVGRLKEIVKETIKENPELIYNAVNRYVSEKRVEAQILKEFEEGFNKRVKESISDRNPSKGPLNAPITIIEYMDFQCPVCSEMAKIMDEIIEFYPEKVGLVFKNNPPKYHARALAATAALAAHKQGRFWEYHDLLFQSVTGSHERVLIKYANDLGLDIEQFNKDRNLEEIARQIESEQARATKQGFTDSPAFIINGVVVNGLYPMKYFTTIIDYLLAEERESEQVSR
ncbi:MAG: thioredoxin domain-containing protein [Desulfobacterales bacterium]|nr:thioredoxin domain-containing protein [Desulfobacterales bacterium]